MGDLMKIKDKVREKIDKLEELREIKELTKGQMADRVGVSRESYSAWVNDRKLPNLDSIEKINDYLEG